MSRDHSRRDSCGSRISSRKFHSEKDPIARGVTDVVVGSGALLAAFLFERQDGDSLTDYRANVEIAHRLA